MTLTQLLAVLRNKLADTSISIKMLPDKLGVPTWIRIYLSDLKYINISLVTQHIGDGVVRDGYDIGPCKHNREYRYTTFWSEKDLLAAIYSMMSLNWK